MSTIYRVLYGLGSPTNDEVSIIRRIRQFTARVTASVIPGKYLVDFFPLMLHLPTWLAKWKREGQRHFDEDTALFSMLLEGVREAKVTYYFPISLTQI